MKAQDNSTICGASSIRVLLGGDGVGENQRFC